MTSYLRRIRHKISYWLKYTLRPWLDRRRWPFVTRRRMETEVERQRELGRMLKRTHAEELADALKLADKLQHTQVIVPHDRQRYRVCVDLESVMVERVFLHGNSQREIDMLAYHLGQKVQHELGQILRARNFVRPDDPMRPPPFAKCRH